MALSRHILSSRNLLNYTRNVSRKRPEGSTMRWLTCSPVCAVSSSYIVARQPPICIRPTVQFSRFFFRIIARNEAFIEISYIPLILFLNFFILHKRIKSVVDTLFKTTLISYYPFFETTNDIHVVATRYYIVNDFIIFGGK
jgi:hypothetical protein